MIEIWFAFLAGLAGSFHCIGMCGGIVAALSMTGSGGVSLRLKSQLCYNLGRITTYTLLGATAGLLGSSLNLPALRSVSSWFLIGANLFVIVIGLSTALQFKALNLSSLETPNARFLAAPLRWATSGKATLAPLYLGLLLGFLPCGLVYAPLISAAATGNIALGGATMAALGLGTLPVLLIFGTASAGFSATVRSLMLRLAGVAVALMGTAGILKALARNCCSM